MLKKELGLKRELTRHECQDCGRKYFKDDIQCREEGVFFKGNYPEKGVCDVIFF